MGYIKQNDKQELVGKNFVKRLEQTHMKRNMKEKQKNYVDLMQEKYYKIYKDQSINFKQARGMESVKFQKLYHVKRKFLISLQN